MPQRFLRPGIRTSQRWNRASFLAQSLYIGILTLVDDFGRYDGRAKLLHGEIFILRDDVKPQQTAAALNELVHCELIQLYQNGGKEYLQVLHWQERARCEQSKFPEPPQHSAADGSDPLLPSPSPSPVHHRHLVAAQPDSLRDYSKEAEEIYLFYPRKVARPAAIKAIKRALRNYSAEFLIDRTRDYATARNGDLSFVPNPATWFNQERFNDNPETWGPRAAGNNGKPIIKTKIDLEYEEHRRRSAERKANEQRTASA